MTTLYASSSSACGGCNASNDVRHDTARPGVGWRTELELVLVDTKGSAGQNDGVSTSSGHGAASCLINNIRADFRTIVEDEAVYSL